jgi:hypothetical protein
MGNDGENDIFIALDLEVEAPVARYPALPYVQRFAVFLRLQGRVVAIGELGIAVVWRTLCEWQAEDAHNLYRPFP